LFSFIADPKHINIYLSHLRLFSERKKKHMLEVTARAKEKLREALFEEQRADPEIIFRITPIHSMPDRLGIALDKENGGDQVVKSEEGIKVLLIESHLAQKLEEMVLDCLLWKPRALHGVAKGNISTFVLPLFNGLWPQKQSHPFHGW
jgi:hypothetical protein